MSATSIKMEGRSFTSIHEMAERIKREIRAELISESYRHIDYVNLCILSFEKYFFRNGSYASLSVVLTEKFGKRIKNIFAVLIFVSFGNIIGPGHSNIGSIG